MNEITYVSGALNESHLIYIASFINSINANSDNKSELTIYFEQNHRFLTKDILSEEIIYKWLGDVICCKKNNIPKSMKFQKITHIHIASVGIKPMLLMRIMNPFSQISNVIVDEGIGSESDFLSISKTYQRERHITILKAHWLAVNYLFIKRRLLCNSIWKLFTNNQPNKYIANFIKSRNIPLKMGGGYVLLLTQPWVKLGVLGAEQYNEYIQDVINICREYDISIILKPHPSEDVDAYKHFSLPIMKSIHPIEINVDPGACKAVIGFNSTALILLNAIYDMPSYRLKHEKLDSVLKISPMQEALFSKFTSKKMCISEICKSIKSRDI